ncbi:MULTISPECIES: hypothetical protein [unclassified Streptomyces]|uniref:hypothetical protein n=1 Tax=unclassified Streptomyces TaxID=2593676 RepID=UPI002E32E0ED|nr:hypothetical protein [Streptomyces sp. NBC_01268]
MSAAANGGIAVGPALGLAAPRSVDTDSETRTSVFAAMPDAERAALWRQRLHEAEAGLTRFLVGLGLAADLEGWFGLQAEMFADLPTGTTGSATAWQRIFFRGQALMERFLVARYGEDVLAEWAAANAEVHRWVEPDRGGGAADPIRRIARQAELYGSDYEVSTDRETGATTAAVDITHCAIWDYREKARSGDGVRLTLASPCTYCTRAMSANVRAKGYQVSYRLSEDRGEHGCRWEATAPAAAPTTAREA